MAKDYWQPSILSEKALKMLIPFATTGFDGTRKIHGGKLTAETPTAEDTPRKAHRGKLSADDSPLYLSVVYLLIKVFWPFYHNLNSNNSGCIDIKIIKNLT